MSTAPIPVQVFHDSKRDTMFAWLSLLLFPVTFVASFLVGEGLATALFDWPGGAEPSVWLILAASVPALVVFALPVIPAWYFGMRAHRNGSRSGRYAAWLAVAIAAGMVVLNVVAYLFG